MTHANPPGKREWWIIDQDNLTIHRGPYKHAETCAAVRTEMEMRLPNKKWNLGIVRASYQELCERQTRFAESDQ